MAVFKISSGLVIKLASVAVHAQELMSPKGHMLDKSAIQGLLIDPEVAECLQELKELGLLPVKR